jgi:mono/diheme cytochrome c family protein
MKKSIVLFGFVVFVIAFSCNKSPKKQADSTETVNETVVTPEMQLMALGYNRMQRNCTICHNSNPAAKGQVAPTIAEIKLQYLKASSDKTAFVQAMTAFTLNPNADQSKMPDAVKKFGLMPKMNFSEQELNAIATYIFNTPLEDADWYKENFSGEMKKYAAIPKLEAETYETKGLNFAMATKAVLGKNLLNAIQTKGTEGALSFCNEQAYHLTDSMSTALNANIKRVSDKNRNPANTANADELAFIENAKSLLAGGQKISPKIIEKGDKVVGYYPILTDKMCLQCHGQPTQDIQSATLARIKTLYPQDKAFGYSENELRGIWVVEMKP